MNSSHRSATANLPHLSLLIVSLLVLPLAACAFDGSVPVVVKVGLVAPFEGEQRTMAYDVLSATKRAIREHNETHRDTGPLVELVALNDNGNPQDAAQKAREIAIDPDILGVLGPWSIHGALASLDIYRQAGLTVMLPGLFPAGPGAAYGEKVVQLIPDQRQVGLAAADYAVDILGARRIAVIQTGDALTEAFVSHLNTQPHLITSTLEWERDRTFVSELRAIEPELVFFNADVSEAVGFVADLTNAEIEYPLLLFGPRVDRFDFRKRVGSETNRVYIVSVVPSSASADQFVVAFEASENRSPEPQAVFAYEAARILLSAIADAGSRGTLSRDAVSAFLVPSVIVVPGKISVLNP